MFTEFDTKKKRLYKQKQHTQKDIRMQLWYNCGIQILKDILRTNGPSEPGAIKLVYINKATFQKQDDLKKDYNLFFSKAQFDSLCSANENVATYIKEYFIEESDKAIPIKWCVALVHGTRILTNIFIIQKGNNEVELDGICSHTLPQKYKYYHPDTQKQITPFSFTMCKVLEFIHSAYSKTTITISLKSVIDAVGAYGNCGFLPDIRRCDKSDIRRIKKNLIKFEKNVLEGRRIEPTTVDIIFDKLKNSDKLLPMYITPDRLKSVVLRRCKIKFPPKITPDDSEWE